jgi:hypothetical protein
MRLRTKAHAFPRHTRSLLSRRGATAAGLSVLLGAAALGVVGPAQALNATGVGPADPGQRGFPAYFTDDAGVALQLCDDGTAACLATGPAELAPVDGEGFYWMATAELVGPGVNLSIEFAAEAAWAGPSSPVTFDRLRIRGDVAEAGDYVVTHPYGTTTVTAEDPANARNVNFTDDVGCAGAVCNFADMATSPNAHITSWITSTTPPAGRLGDGSTAEAATVAGAPASVSVDGPGGSATTDQFVVMGKLANPRAVSVPTAVNFGNVRGTRTKNVRLLNLGTQPLTISAATLTGSKAITQTRTSTCASGRVLAIGKACTVGLRYRPNGKRQAAATLRIRDDAGLHAVRVRASSTAAVSVRKRLHFRSVRAHATGHTRRVVVTNRGALPLKVRSVKVAGRNARSFDIRSGAPRVCARGTSVPAGAQCAVYVGFEPRSFGPKKAGLVIRTNGLPASHTVSLSGSGR